jgi:hypothetical protein
MAGTYLDSKGLAKEGSELDHIVDKFNIFQAITKEMKPLGAGKHNCCKFTYRTVKRKTGRRVLI